MGKNLRHFVKYASISFAILIVLSFSPLSTIAWFLAASTMDWGFFFIMLFLAGAPFGGFLFMLIFTRPNKWAFEASGLAGMWAGALIGARVGFSLMETLKWT